MSNYICLTLAKTRRTALTPFRHIKINIKYIKKVKPLPSGSSRVYTVHKRRGYDIQESADKVNNKMLLVALADDPKTNNPSPCKCGACQTQLARVQRIHKLRSIRMRHDRT